MLSTKIIKDTREQACTRKAIIWSKGDVLAQGIDHVFGKSGVWDVIQVSKEDDVESFVQVTKQLKPQVVVLCQSSLEEDPILPLRLINESISLTVIIVSLNSNLTQVYSKQNLIIEEGQDLLSILETGNLSSCTQGKEVK